MGATMGGDGLKKMIVGERREEPDSGELVVKAHSLQEKTHSPQGNVFLWEGGGSEAAAAALSGIFGLAYLYIYLYILFY
jgi:hypothetical protein